MFFVISHHLNIINQYGADSVRFFILADSPPERDVQWSDEGMKSSYKFIQKLWTLNLEILKEIKKNHQNDVNEELDKFTNKFIEKITNNLETFSYNVVIANLHEMSSHIKKIISLGYTKKTIEENYSKILTCMLPIIPHFTSECLSELKIKKYVA